MAAALSDLPPAAAADADVMDKSMPRKPHIAVVAMVSAQITGHFAASVGLLSAMPRAATLARLHALYCAHRFLHPDVSAATPWRVAALPSDLPAVRDLVDDYVALCALLHGDAAAVGHMSDAARALGTALSQRRCLTPECAGQYPCALHTFTCDACAISGTHVRRGNMPQNNVCVAHELLRCSACGGALYTGRAFERDRIAGCIECSRCMASLCRQCGAAHRCASAAQQ